jgi:ubiquinone/menaquinone biosynthesis C-methylase UbiE
MTHTDHIQLIQAIAADGGVWADLGSGTGAFTLALRELLGPTCHIYSVDLDASSLVRQQHAFDRQYPESNLTQIVADFRQPLKLPPLDGIIYANSLHYVPNQLAVLQQALGYLVDLGKLVIVEYNVSTGNIWVPHPLSFVQFRHLAAEAGFSEPQLLSTVPSQFLREIYAACCTKPA